jgi:hypothetical protein
VKSFLLVLAHGRGRILRAQLFYARGRGPLFIVFRLAGRFRLSGHFGRPAPCFVQLKKAPRLASQTRGQTTSLASTSVVKASMAVNLEFVTAEYGCRLDSAQIVSRGLSGLAIGDDFVADLLTFVEIAHSCAFDRAYVNENVLAAVVRLNEAETLLAIKPLYSSCRHRTPSFGYESIDNHV